MLACLCVCVCVCVGPYDADLLLSLPESLHLRRVRHDAEAATFALLKVLLVLHLQDKTEKTRLQVT